MARAREQLATDFEATSDFPHRNARAAQPSGSGSTRDSNNRFTRRRCRQIPLYLQHVLDRASRTDGDGYTEEPDNYNALINAALDFESVLFLTLNYDTLLDDRLFLYWSLDELSDYVGSDPTWALVKLHGSGIGVRRAR